jgi:hypothetical protein
MIENLDGANIAIQTEADLINQIRVSLNGKAAGGEGVTLPELSNPGDATKVLADYEFIDGEGNVVTGTMPDRTIIGQNGVVGYHESYPNTPISEAIRYFPVLNTDGVTRLCYQVPNGYYDTDSYVGAQVPMHGGGSVTPQSAAQSIVSPGTYVTGEIIIEAGTELNFEVIGGTAEPVNPKENTIWVNTNNQITSWQFDYVQPSNPSEGLVWFETISTTAPAEFNALSTNGIKIRLNFAR